MMDDDQEEHFVAADSVDPELLVAETLDYSVFNKLIVRHTPPPSKFSGHGRE